MRRTQDPGQDGLPRFEVAKIAIGSENVAFAAEDLVCDLDSYRDYCTASTLGVFIYTTYAAPSRNTTRTAFSLFRSLSQLA